MFGSRKRRARKEAQQQRLSDLVRKEARLEAATAILHHHLNDLTQNVRGTPAARLEVERWVFDLYSVMLPPQIRYTDVQTAQEGHENLVYRNVILIRKEGS